MKKIFVLGCMLAGAFTVSAQQSSLLEKYRNMALEYNHDLKAAEKNISGEIRPCRFETESGGGRKFSVHGKSHGTIGRCAFVGTFRGV